MITRKIGLNRGKRRIWLEGVVLTAAGIYHGMRFNVVNSGNSLMILVADDGKRKIAGTVQRPIIDMSGSTITASFEDSTHQVRIDPIRKGTNGSLPGIILTGIE